MSNSANSQTLYGAVKLWVIAALWQLPLLFAGPMLLLVIPLFLIAIGEGEEDMKMTAMFFLMVSPFIVCFWTVLINRRYNIQEYPDATEYSEGAIFRRVVRFLGGFVLGFFLPIAAELSYLFLIAMPHAVGYDVAGNYNVISRWRWLVWFAGYEVVAFSPIVLLWVRRNLVRGNP